MTWYGPPSLITGMSGNRRPRSHSAWVCGTRVVAAEVTGGRHLDSLQELVVSVFVDAGVPAHLMGVRRLPIAGYFRRDKSWDIVVMVADRVVGIIELKSMAGGSPGQNYNNRTDEALGQAVDVWKAVEREIIDTPLRPWLGYFMLLEDNDAFTRAVQVRTAVWEPDPVFDGASYADRYVIFFERMVRERLLGRGLSSAWGQGVRRGPISVGLPELPGFRCCDPRALPSVHGY